MSTNKLLLLVVVMFLQTYNWFAQAQKPFLEPFFITDSISVNEWIEQTYGEDVQYYESARIRHRHNVVENSMGWEHFSYDLTYNDIPLEFCQINVHKKDGEIVSVNGLNYDTINISHIPTIDESVAREIAISHIDASVYSWQYEYLDYFDSIGAPHLKYLPQGQLVICPDDFNNDNANPRLAYKFEIYAVEPESNTHVYVDANIGTILLAVPRMYSITGRAETRFSGVQSIETTLILGQYCLRDNTRCEGQTTIKTRDLRNTYDSPFWSRRIDDDDNNWTAIEYHATREDAALDAHWGAEMTIDYFYDKFSRASIDDRNKTVKNYVRWNVNNNAAWNGYVIKYGDGGSNFQPFVGLDIVAHEIGHAVTEFSSGLVYKNESGAINESISDIWGACVTRYADPTKNIWSIGEDCYSGDRAIRQMDYPKRYWQPDTYNGLFWQNYNIDTTDEGGVHTNSGVMNYWFYLLTQGGSGTNDHGYNYIVTGVGFEKSEQIVYHALTNYFTKKTDYSLAAVYTIASAIELYGVCSDEANSVIAAWKAVGVAPHVDMDIQQYLLLTNDISEATSILYRAVDSIKATNVIYAGATVSCEAGNLIRLSNGFHAKKGSKFHAYIKDCYPSIANSASKIPQKQKEECEGLTNNNTNETIETIENSRILSTSIYTISGQLIQTISGGQHSAAHLPNGLYILQHRMSDGSVRCEKIANNK